MVEFVDEWGDESELSSLEESEERPNCHTEIPQDIQSFKCDSPQERRQSPSEDLVAKRHRECLQTRVSSVGGQLKMDGYVVKHKKL